MIDSSWYLNSTEEILNVYEHKQAGQAEEHVAFLVNTAHQLNGTTEKALAAHSSPVA